MIPMEKAWTAMKSERNSYEKLTRHSTSPGNIFLSLDGKTKSGTPCDKLKTKEKRARRKKKARKDVGWTNKLAKSRTSDICTEATRDRDARKVKVNYVEKLST